MKKYIHKCEVGALKQAADYGMSGAGTVVWKLGEIADAHDLLGKLLINLKLIIALIN